MTHRCSAAFAALVATATLPMFAACQRGADSRSGPYAAEVAAAIPAIEKAVGLKFKTPPRLELKTKDEVRGFLEKKFDEQQPALELAGQERAYKLFGLLPDTLNLRKFLLVLLAEQIVGYYDPATKVLYVVSGGGSGRSGPSPEIVNVTITHELVHALQDQYLNLDSLSKVHGDNDRQSAAQAVVEGQATFEQLNAMLGGGSLSTRLPGGWDRVREMIRDGQASMPIFSTAPMLIQETLLFPYLSGAEFIRQYKEKNSGGVPYSTMPVSTEQVMHPDKLLQGSDKPVRVKLPKPSVGSVVYENNLGEFETRLFLFQQLKDVAQVARAAEGWGGDRYYVINTGQGAGLTWLSVWDTPMDAGEFREALLESVEQRFGVKGSGAGEAVRFSAKGRTVEVVAATVNGRSAVLYTDVPAGASTRLIELKQVKTEQ